MKNIFIAVLAVTIFACNQAAKTKEVIRTDQPALPLASHEAGAFIVDFLLTCNQPVFAVTTLRNRYFTKRDAAEIKTYFTKLEHPEYINELKFDQSDELLIDTNTINKNITWVDDHDIYTCRTVLRDLWPCFKNKYGGNEFYYFGIPQFTKDGKYALVSINLSSSDKEKSRGGTRLFEKEKGRWREIAILTNWGADPE